MSYDLVLTPSGRLHLHDDRREEAPVESWGRRIAASFASSPACGLFSLAASRPETPPPPVFSYWRDFAARYLTELCRTPESVASRIDPVAPPVDAELATLLLSAPPMQGGEYLTAEALRDLWVELDGWVRGEIAALDGGVSAWLKKHAPMWHQIGRVCFHLAENKNDPEFPFAFLATYAPKLSAGGRVQYQPLGRALEEYAGKGNKKALINLLVPVQRASEKVGFVKELLDSGELFHPIAWSPGEAYRLLTAVPLLEDSGLLVRLPDWWRSRPRPRVAVKIGEKSQGRFGADAMLDFHVGVALGDEELTEDEWRRIIASEEGLAYVKGQWVEVDREKLSEALAHWKRLEAEAGAGGISFIEGMRLLAGAPADLEADGRAGTEEQEWSFVDAGSWLSGVLSELRHPAAAGPSTPGFRGQLRPYQELGRNWLWLLSSLGLGACLADDMGLGKTVQVLSLLLALQDRMVADTDSERSSGRGSAGRGRGTETAERGSRKAGRSTTTAGGAPENPSRGASLLVLPASLLANWKSEIARFAPTLRTFFAHPSENDPAALASAAEKPQEVAAESDVVLTTYGMVLRQKWLQQVHWRLVILDEAQAIKNPAARQTKAVKQLEADARIALTGTPIENRLSDLWSLFDFLAPGLLGSAERFKRFVKSLEARRQERYAPLRNLVQPYILRRMKTDKSIIADLPDKVEMKAFCGLSKRQAALYARSVDELAAALEGLEGMKRRGLVLSYLMRFKQICNHPSQYTADGGYDPAESGKFERLQEICEEIASRQEKALVFTQFREMTEPIASFLAGVFGREGLVLHGATEVKKRKALVDLFQSDEGPPFFVLSLKAGGTGLNLTAATHVVHFDRWWNPAVENQATDRAFRIGQHRNVVVHKFVTSGTVEEKIDALIEEKSNLAEDLLAGGAESLLTEMSDEELLKIVALDVERVEV